MQVNVIQDFATGQGKGFGFVTMPNAQEAEAAVAALNGTEFNGNSLQIRFKSPKVSSYLLCLYSTLCAVYSICCVLNVPLAVTYSPNNQEGSGVTIKCTVTIENSVA